MQFLREPWSAGMPKLIEALTGPLAAGKRVLWLVPGGSNIQIAVEVMRALPAELTTKLVIMLTDERYGPVGHKDSNALQLQEAGFEPKRARFIPILQANLLIDEAAELYGENFTSEADEATEIVAQFGIGADGHIAGILPGSPAATATQPAAGYHSEQFDRLTLTFASLKRISVAFAFVYGADKTVALTRLHDQNLELSEQPAQILKQIPAVYVYNDSIA